MSEVCLCSYSGEHLVGFDLPITILSMLAMCGALCRENRIQDLDPRKCARYLTLTDTDLLLSTQLQFLVRNRCSNETATAVMKQPD
jgi:hypothetical protein